MSWAADGLDGKGLHLEKIRLVFFKFIVNFYLGNLAKTLIMVDFLLENSLDIFLLVFLVQQRYLNLI